MARCMSQPVVGRGAEQNWPVKWLVMHFLTVLRRARDVGHEAHLVASMVLTVLVALVRVHSANMGSSGSGFSAARSRDS